MIDHDMIDSPVVCSALSHTLSNICSLAVNVCTALHDVQLPLTCFFLHVFEPDECRLKDACSRDLTAVRVKSLHVKCYS